MSLHSYSQALQRHEFTEEEKKKGLVLVETAGTEQDSSDSEEDTSISENINELIRKFVICEVVITVFLSLYC